MKAKLLSLLLNNIDNNIKHDYSADEKKLIREIVPDFPLILKSESLYVDFKEAMLDKSIKDICYYSDKIFNASSQTKYPFKKAKIGVINGTISSSILNNEELIDFSGNSANSQYYKAIKQLILNDGKYLKQEYNESFLNEHSKNVINALETWYKGCKIDSSPKLSKSYTSQILIPKNGTYIAISPAQSVGMISKLIEVNREIANNSFTKRQELTKQVKLLKERLSKIKDENFETIEQLKEQIEELSLEIKKLPFVKKAIWQIHNSKQYNMSLLAPSSKNGILLSEAPSYDYEKAKLFSFNNDSYQFFRKTLSNLSYKNDNFKAKLRELFALLDTLFDPSYNTNRREKNQLEGLNKYLFKAFLSAIKDEEAIQKDALYEADLPEIFIDFLVDAYEKPISRKSIYKIYSNLEGVQLWQE